MLKLLGKIYGSVANLRNALYDRGIFKSYPLDAKTISIGNLTTGGTGKTPLVAHVAEILAEAGEKVCILTRGYGRVNPRSRVLVSDGRELLADARTGGDEPVELARKLIGKAIVVADPDRVSAASWAMEKFAVTAFVLDDGFQHRRVKRDLDIVCVDATDPCGGGLVLPAGSLREPFRNVGRADAIVVTRANLVESVDDTVSRLQQRSPHVPVFISRTEITDLIGLSEFESEELRDNKGVINWKALRDVRETHTDDEVRVLAFCALGNPNAFFTQLLSVFDDERTNESFDLAVTRKFPDHHRFSQSDIAALEQQARDVDADILMTTVKDAVKLKGLKFEIPCFVVVTEVSIDDPQRFRDLVLSA